MIIKLIELWWRMDSTSTIFVMNSLHFDYMSLGTADAEICLSTFASLSSWSSFGVWSSILSTKRWIAPPRCVPTEIFSIGQG